MIGISYKGHEKINIKSRSHNVGVENQQKYSPSKAWRQAHSQAGAWERDKRLLVAILLGFFAGKKWDGNYISNGTIVVKETGEQVGFHIIDKASLENYLFENIVRILFNILH